MSEHPPLPGAFLARCAYPPGALADIPMGEGQMDAYVRDMLDLKVRYRDRIRLLVGLEVDYLPDDEPWTRALLADYGRFLDDGLLSVHYLPGAGGWRCVDMAPEDLDEGLVRHHGGFAAFEDAYYALVRRAAASDLGPFAPRRIGHLTVCRKFRRCFPEADRPAPEVGPAIEAVLDLVRARGYALDANMAGLFKEHCGEPYTPPPVAAAARARGIPLVYGSDAHAVADVGRGYGAFERLTAPDAAPSGPGAARRLPGPPPGS